MGPFSEIQVVLGLVETLFLRCDDFMVPTVSLQTISVEEIWFQKQGIRRNHCLSVAP